MDSSFSSNNNNNTSNNKIKFKGGIKPLEFQKLKGYNGIMPNSTQHNFSQKSSSKFLSPYQQSEAILNLRTSPFPQLVKEQRQHHHANRRSETSFKKETSARIHFSHSPPQEHIQKTKRQSSSFFSNQNDLSQVVFDSSQFMEEKMIIKYKNFLLQQKNEQQKKNQIKDIKVKNIERNLEQLELSLQKEKDPKIKVAQQMSFMQNTLKSILGSKPKSLLLQRIIDSLSQSFDQSINSFSHQLQVNTIEKQKLTNLLRQHLKEIQKYKDMENAQEVRLKNMFEHLRQLDLEILSFTENNEILEAKMEVAQPMAVLDEQQKQRTHNHHNMKLLEFDLQTIYQQVKKDLSKVLENEDAEVQGMDPKYLADQVKIGISDTISGLQEKIHKILLGQHNKSKNSKVDKSMETDAWDFQKYSDALENLTRDNLNIEKERKWLKTKIERSVVKEVEKDEKILGLTAKVEKGKETELEIKRLLHEKDNFIRDLKIDLASKGREIVELEQTKKELEEKIIQQEVDLKKVESNYRNRLLSQQQSSQNFNRKRSSIPQQSRKQSSVYGGGPQVDDGEQSTSQFMRKKNSTAVKHSQFDRDESMSQNNSIADDQYDNISQQSKNHLQIVKKQKGGQSSIFNQKRGSNKSSFLQLNNDRIHGTPSKSNCRQERMIDKKKDILQQFITPQTRPRKLIQNGLKQIMIFKNNQLEEPTKKSSDQSRAIHNILKSYHSPTSEKIEQFEANTPTIVKSESIFKNEIIKHQQESIFSPQAQNLPMFEFSNLNGKQRSELYSNNMAQSSYKTPPDQENTDQDDDQYAARQNSYELQVLQDNLSNQNSSQFQSNQDGTVSQFNQVDRQIVHMKVKKKNLYSDDQAITEESNEQQEDKQVQTDLRKVGVDIGIQAFDEVYSLYQSNNNISNEVMNRSINQSLKKIKNFSKLKINFSAIQSYNYSPRLDGDTSMNSPDRENYHSGEPIVVNFVGPEIEQSHRKSKEERLRITADKSLLHFTGRDRLKVIKINQSAHIMASNIKPDSEFKETVIGSSSPFKLHQ